MQRQVDIQCEQILALLFLICQFFSVCKIGKKILTYKKYVRNLNQSNFNLLANYTYIKIVIVSIINIDFFEY